MKKNAKKRNSFAFIATVVLTLAVACSACGGNKPLNPDVAAGNTSVGQSGDNSGKFAETIKDVTVTLTTDKSEYNEGEEIHYTLTVNNGRRHYKIDKANVNYTNTEGFVAREGEELPFQFPILDENQEVSIEGVIVHRDGVKGGNNPVRASEGDFETVNFRPYVKVTYAGQEVTIRATIELHLFQKYININSTLLDRPKTVTCHDPSIFRDFDGEYYIIGSFLAGAKTDDLRNWTSIDSTFHSAFSKEDRALIKEWNDDDTANGWNGYLWAPDIVFNPILNKYCMYISANGDNWKSNIVLATADDVEGPYTYAGTIVYGGFSAENFGETDAPMVLGTDTIPERYVTYGIKNKKWGDMYPNCIDPCVFYDDDGNLWMSYGSWSGGIFMLELDEETGLRDYNVSYETNEHSDAYFGKKISGGAYVSGEASYIQKIGDYYYLFISYGNLEAAGGYNVRIYRSASPDGPYLDAVGNSSFSDKYIFNYNLPQGVRLFGGYKWRTFVNGQVAQGHNSAFVDEDGRAYIVFHTRTTNGTEGHYVKVHQLFTNKEGWIVAAPYQTNGEALSESGITSEDVVGEYDVILHELEIDYKHLEVNKPKCVFLNADNTISGEYTGTWKLEDDADNPNGSSYLTLTINGVNYSGVGFYMDVEGTKINTFVFTALGDTNQLTIWGSKVFE